MTYRALARVILCIGFLFTISSCTSLKSSTESVYPAWMVGEWKGVGLQLNIRQTWMMELKVENKKQFEIRYPTLECTGVWKLKTATHSNAEFIEMITYGNDRCTNGGKIIITKIDQNHLSFSYFSSNGNKLQAHSTLVNVKYKESLKI